MPRKCFPGARKPVIIFKKRRRLYATTEKVAAIEALAANGWNVGRTARQLGIPAETLRSWANTITISQADRPLILASERIGTPRRV